MPLFLELYYLDFRYLYSNFGDVLVYLYMYRYYWIIFL
jgi:hypothetical protein